MRFSTKNSCKTINEFFYCFSHLHEKNKNKTTFYFFMQLVLFIENTVKRRICHNKWYDMLNNHQ